MQSKNKVFMCSKTFRISVQKMDNFEEGKWRIENDTQTYLNN